MCDLHGYKPRRFGSAKNIMLRKWTRTDRVALAELIEAYEETGRLALDPIPFPLSDEVERFNRQAGYIEGEGRGARGIRDQIKRAREGMPGGGVSRSVRDSVKGFKTREEKEAYAQAAALFEGGSLEQGDRKRPREEAFGPDSNDTDEVKALKREVMEQKRKLAILQQEKESRGLAVFKKLKDSLRLSESSLTSDELMCLALMFFNRHVRFSEQGMATSILRVEELGGFMRDGAPDMAGALSFLGEPFFRRCRDVLSWGGTVFVQFPVEHVHSAAERVLGPADLAGFCDQRRLISVLPREGDPPDEAVDVTIDASYICLAHRVVSMGFDILRGDPEYSGEVRAAAFDSARLKRNGWTTIIPQSLLVCETLAPRPRSV